MIIFKSQMRWHPIRGVPDNVSGVGYRSSPKGWMDGRVWHDWLCEPRAISALPSERQRVLYVDNCSSHSEGPRAAQCLREINTTMQKLPPNSTHLTQPADSFIIQKIKEVWRRRWDTYKYECIKNGLWMNTINGKGIGKLPNPGKGFLRLAADSVREVNAMRDKNGASYARKAIIWTGMSLNVNGLWEEGQLTDDLQHIIAQA